MTLVRGVGGVVRVILVKLVVPVRALAPVLVRVLVRVRLVRLGLVRGLGLRLAGVPGHRYGAARAVPRARQRGGALAAPALGPLLGLVRCGRRVRGSRRGGRDGVRLGAVRLALGAVDERLLALRRTRGAVAAGCPPVRGSGAALGQGGLLRRGAPLRLRLHPGGRGARTGAVRGDRAAARGACGGATARVRALETEDARALGVTRARTGVRAGHTGATRTGRAGGGRARATAPPERVTRVRRLTASGLLPGRLGPGVPPRDPLGQRSARQPPRRRRAPAGATGTGARARPRARTAR
ncbi:hypothetical protein [Streptomyces armeniacus]|uniref:hypothetical protein n=1 Tax=Streptomyces armeniacus TaxID=83291 RepID=UPI001FE290BA|nr:hypothetical protein [Streptomyces armeniacus]